MRYTHNRQTWLKNRTWLSAPAFNWNRIDHIVLHWPGHDNVPDGDPGELITAVPTRIYNEHLAYMRKDRPYSLGYNVMVDWLGGTWEVRGDEYRCAANAPAEMNARSFAIQLMIDKTDGIPTTLMIESVRDLIRQVRAKSPNKVKVITHRQCIQLYSTATRTECAGERIQQLLALGAFENENGSQSRVTLRMGSVTSRIILNWMPLTPAPEHYYVRITDATGRVLHQEATRATSYVVNFPPGIDAVWIYVAPKYAGGNDDSRSGVAWLKRP